MRCKLLSYICWTFSRHINVFEKTHLARYLVFSQPNCCHESISYQFSRPYLWLYFVARIPFQLDFASLLDWHSSKALQLKHFNFMTSDKLNFQKAFTSLVILVIY